MAEHITPIKTYVAVLAALLLLLALTTWLGFVDLGRYLPGPWWNVMFALAIAIIKAVMVVLIFMHVKYQSRLTWLFAAAGFVWLTILVTMSMTDYLSRNWPPGVNPKGEPTFLKPDPATPDMSASSGAIPHQ
jgi:cytochrome c oxidase subunit IV